MDKKERLMSIDALRGADMLFIMGFSGVVVAFCQLFGFGKDCWLATQMSHVLWHGLRHHDTIFPLFLFLAGVSWPFSYASQMARGRTTGQIVRKILLRVIALVFLGMVSAKFFAFDVKSYRYDSVLAHIGVCWAMAALLYMCVKSFTWRLVIAVLLLVAHFALLTFCSAPDAAELLASTDPAVIKKVAAYAATGTDSFSFIGNIAGWVDRAFMPGRLHEGIFDPDGLLAKMTGVVTAMLGVFAGELLRKRELSGSRKSVFLFGAGAVALILCLAWRPWCPVNKKIWNSTFVLAAGAYSYLMLALFYWIIDVKGWRRWTFFFRVIGMNSITIYVMMRFVDFRTISTFFLSGVASWGNAHWSALVIGLGQVTLAWLVLLYLYRKNTFLKV